VDEVNLLPDHLVDLLLDAAASGINHVERDGISHRHAARFVLIGSGNPEEGDLRPQLLDRFGLHARIKTLHDIEQRVEVVRRRLAFENDASAFVASFDKEQSALRKRLQKAINAKPKVTLPESALMLAAQLCDRLGIDGHRGELALTRAAVALAAYEGKKSADPELVARVAPLALAHRLRKDPLEPAADDERVKRVLEEALG
jgi:magnesium chelatase subunit I